MRKNSLIIIAVVVIALWGIYDFVKMNELEKEKNEQQQKNANVEVGIQKGQMAPDFSLMDLSGKKVSLSDFRGENVILNFWATWCPPCKAEMPHMQKFWENEEAVVLAVNLTSTETSDMDVKNFVEQYTLTFPIVLDDLGETMRHYRVIAYPTSYVIDAEGIIYEKYEGAISYDTMKKIMAQIDN